MVYVRSDLFRRRRAKAFLKGIPVIGFAVLPAKIHAVLFPPGFILLMSFHSILRLNLLALTLSLLASTSVSAQAHNQSGQKFRVLVSADDSFELFINGKAAWSGADFQNVLRTEVAINRDDVLVFVVTDKQGGKGGHFAAVILDKDDSVIASTKDFRYSVTPAEDFFTGRSVAKLRVPDLTALDNSFGIGVNKQPKKAWTRKADDNHAVVHFKYVFGGA